MADIVKRKVRTKAMAERNSVSQAQIRDWFHEGVLPGYQVGKTILFDPVECDQALERFKRHGKTIAAK
jgi:hypothetical protein